MKKTLSIVLFVLLVFLAVACSPETHKHTWDEGKVTLEPSCTESGVRTYTCTVCNETKTEAIAKKGHSHAEDDKGYVSVVANCIIGGKKGYVCKDCGEAYYEATDKDYTNHVYYNSEKKEYEKIEKFDEKYCEYSEGVEVAKTYFTPASKVAYCKSCGHKIDSITTPASTDAEFEKIASMWIYKTADGKSTYYVDVVEGDNQKVTVTVVETVYGDSGYTTSRWEDTTGALETKDNVRTLSVGSSSKNTYFWLTGDSSGNLKLYVDNQETKPNSAIDFEKTKAALDEKDGHNHKYSESHATDTEKSSSIYSDSDFEVMNFLGTPYIDATNNCHYVECKKCGMNYLKVSHLSSDWKNVDESNSCSACKYSGKSDAYYTLTVNWMTDANALEDANAALAAAKSAVDAATGIHSADTNNNATGVSGLLNAKNALIAAKKALENTNTTGLSGDGKFTDNAYLKICNLLQPENSYQLTTSDKPGDTPATGTKTSAENSIVMAYEEVKGDASTSGSSQATVLKLAAVALASADTSSGLTSYTGGAYKLLKDYAEDETKTKIESFCLATGAKITLSTSKYTSFANKTYYFATNSSWIPSRTGISFDGLSWVVSGDTSMSFAKKAL